MGHLDLQENGELVNERSMITQSFVIIFIIVVPGKLESMHVENRLYKKGVIIDGNKRARIGISRKFVKSVDDFLTV